MDDGPTGSQRGRAEGLAGAMVAVMTTVGTRADADRLAEAAVQQRLAACVQMHAIASVYRWQGKLQHDSEWRLLFKTTPEREAMLTRWLAAQHPYALPAIGSMAVAIADPRFAQWLIDETHTP